jgi:hypothetical protein
MNLTRDEFPADAGLALNKNREIGCRDALDDGAERLHRRRRTDKRRSVVTRLAPEREQPGSNKLQSQPFDLQDECADVCGEPERLEVPLIDGRPAIIVRRAWTLGSQSPTHDCALNAAVDADGTDISGTATAACDPAREVGSFFCLLRQSSPRSPCIRSNALGCPRLFGSGGKDHR